MVSECVRWELYEGQEKEQNITKFYSITTLEQQ